MTPVPAAIVSPLAGIAGAFVVIDHDGTVMDRNDAAAHLLGVSKHGSNLWAVLPDSLVSTVRSVVDEANRCGDRCVSPDPAPCSGSWYRVVVTPAAKAVAIHVLDVTDLVHAEQRVRVLEAEASRRDADLNDLLASWGMQVSYVDRALRYTKVFNAPSSYPVKQYLGKRVYEFADNAAGHAIATFQLEVLTSGRTLRREISFHDGVRDRTWLVYGEPIRGDDRTAEGVKTVALDVSGMREAEAAATTDYLTGVTNRRAMEALVLQETSRATRYGTVASVIMADVDRFKAVNDTFGHPVGDAVLRALVVRLGEELRSADVVARWGGEEFLVLLPETCREEAARVAERMRQRVAAEPFDVVGTVTVSLGVATTAAGEQADDLLARADAACLMAKRHGRNLVIAADTGQHADLDDAVARPLFPDLRAVAEAVDRPS